MGGKGSSLHPDRAIYNLLCAADKMSEVVSHIHKRARGELLSGDIYILSTSTAVGTRQICVFAVPEI